MVLEEEGVRLKKVSKRRNEHEKLVDGQKKI